MIDKEHPLAITRQCTLLDISRASIYYEPVLVSDTDKELIRIIDEIHLEDPYLGSRGIKSILRRKGYTVGRIHVRTLMGKMGIEAPHPGHKIYHYLDITKANEVWCSDITYIPIARGFCYLVAVMDWSSRKVLSFRLSNTLGVSLETISKSAWTDLTAGETTYSWSASGRHLNTRRYT